MMQRIVSHLWVLGLLLSLSLTAAAQNQFAATLEVLAPNVTVLRAGTVNPIVVQVEAIVGVGDVITTDEGGRARITFFADGTDATLEENTEYRIVQLEGDENAFQITVEVLAGQTSQRLNRLLNPESSYEVETPGMILGARGTEFAIRVEDSGRSAMLVREGTVAAADQGTEADVPAMFGIRSEVGGALSDVVRADTFAELDSALDGCAVQITTSDDVSINVRRGPSLDEPLLGYIEASAIQIVLGTNASGNWYRIPFQGQAGWLLSSSAQVSNCARLRVFPDDFVETTAASEE